LNPSEVKHIALTVLKEVGITVSSVVQFKPKMKTREVCEYLPCDRKWLYKNKDLFGGRIVNRRKDYEFDTDKVVNYKLKRHINL